MNAKQIAVLLAIIGAASILLGYQSTSEISEFQAWQHKFGMKFSSEFEKTYRERVFLANLANINAHNSKEERTYDMGLNQFSALTQEEFVQTYLGTIVPNTVENIEEEPIEVETTVSVGDIDWTTQGVVTPVKNQGSCGSCWAFSATGALEALSKQAYGNLQSFSEQQLVDCSGSFGNQACNGGLMDNAFKYVKAKGIVQEEEYKYKGAKGNCLKDSGPFKISGYTDVSKNCNDLTSALAGRPIAIAVDASNWSPYKSGVFNNCKTSLNHGVLLVGIVGDNWKVKNSWGQSWGVNGYITLAKGNTCGLCNAASYPNK